MTELLKKKYDELRETMRKHDEAVLEFRDKMRKLDQELLDLLRQGHRELILEIISDFLKQQRES